VEDKVRLEAVVLVVLVELHLEQIQLVVQVQQDKVIMVVEVALVH
jgi:hypothetical protein